MKLSYTQNTDSSVDAPPKYARVSYLLSFVMPMFKDYRYMLAKCVLLEEIRNEYLL